jgi:hypothetical protein
LGECPFLRDSGECGREGAFLQSGEIAIQFRRGAKEQITVKIENNHGGAFRV